MLDDFFPISLVLNSYEFNVEMDDFNEDYLFDKISTEIGHKVNEKRFILEKFCNNYNLST